MRFTIDKEEFQSLRNLVSQGKISEFYGYMESQGYKYAGLASGVFSASNSSGIVAIAFLEKTADNKGRSLSSTELDKIKIDMAKGYLDALQTQIDSDGKVTREISADEAWAFHNKIFEQHNLPRDAWTLNTPFLLFGNNTEGREALWQDLLEGQTNPFYEFYAGNSSYAAVWAISQFSIDPQIRSQAEGWLERVNSVSAFAKQGEILLNSIRDHLYDYVKSLGTPTKATTALHTVDIVVSAGAEKFVSTIGEAAKYLVDLVYPNGGAPTFLEGAWTKYLSGYTGRLDVEQIDSNGTIAVNFGNAMFAVNKDGTAIRLTVDTTGREYTKTLFNGTGATEKIEVTRVADDGSMITKMSGAWFMPREDHISKNGLLTSSTTFDQSGPVYGTRIFEYSDRGDSIMHHKGPYGSELEHYDAQGRAIEVSRYGTADQLLSHSKYTYLDGGKYVVTTETTGAQNGLNSPNGPPGKYENTYDVRGELQAQSQYTLDGKLFKASTYDTATRSPVQDIYYDNSGAVAMKIVYSLDDWSLVADRYDSQGQKYAHFTGKDFSGWKFLDTNGNIVSDIWSSAANTATKSFDPHKGGASASYNANKPIDTPKIPELEFSAKEAIALADKLLKESHQKFSAHMERPGFDLSKLPPDFFHNPSGEVSFVNDDDLPAGHITIYPLEDIRPVHDGAHL